MRILILTDYYPPDKLGGVGEIAKNLKQAYDAKGHRTWVLTTGQNRDEERVIRSSSSLIWGTFINNFKVIQLIRKKNIEVINLHQSITTLFLLTKYIPFLYKQFPRTVNSFQVSYFSEFSNIRTVKVGNHKFRPAFKEYIEKWINAPIHIFLDWVGYVFSDIITVVSTENKKEFEKTYGRASRKKINIVPNGVSIQDFAPSKPSLEPSFMNKLSGKFVLLYVGVFRARKRVFNLLFALHKLAKTNPDVVLVLVGGGRNYERDILNLVSELKLNNNVFFVGRVPNEKVINYLNVSDVFCLLSSYEGMPIAILEAMACGKAILTSRVSGMVDLIEDGQDGYLTKVDDVDDIVKKLGLLVGDPKKTRAMGENTRKKIMNHYSWDKIAQSYIGLFKS